MPTLVWCLTIVAAFHVSIAAAEGLYEDVPAHAPTLAVARTLGLDPARDRARLFSELIRLIYSRPVGRVAESDALVVRLNDPNASSSPDAAVVIPVPLSAARWSQVLGREIAPERLAATLLSDRRAALLAYGLTALDDETLSFLERDTALLSRLYRFSAPAIAAFADALRIRSGSVVPPGGASAVRLWETLVGQPVTAPAEFIPALYEMSFGRVAYLYNLIGELDEPRAAFALGLWMPDEAVRSARFMALSSLVMRAYPEWRLDLQPFSKPLSDLAFLLMRMRVAPSGAPLEPSSMSFWSATFASDNPLESSPPPAPGPLQPVDAAFLAEATSFVHPYTRGDRLDQIAFAQRAFAGSRPEQWSDMLAATRAFRRERMLMLSLERAGITDPATYAAVARSVSNMNLRDPNRAFWSLSQLQGALAIVLRMAQSGTLNRTAAAELLTSLCAVPMTQDGRYAGAIGAWLETRLLPLMPPADDVEGRLIAGIAGPSDRRTPRVSWEGQDYRLDLAAAEAHRIRVVRERQRSYTLDAALALFDLTRAFAAGTKTAQDVRALSASLFTYSQEHARTLGRLAPEAVAEGVRLPPPASETVQRAVGDLTSLASNRDARRLERVEAQLIDLVDVLLGESLLSMAYAMDIGDPDGTALLARNVALRHDFGLSHRDPVIRNRLSWSMPRQDSRPGVPWHVSGSLLGLDVALAPLSLKRLTGEALSEAPKLSPVERDGFSVAVAMMDPRRLRDEDRDAIAAAIARGRQRVAAMSGEEEFSAVADLVGLDGRRRRAIRWMLDHDRERVSSMFSLVDLLEIGGGAPNADLDAWGMAGLQWSSCPCTELVRSRDWQLLEGRPQVGLMASGMADLNLHVAMMLHELGMPAPLAQPVLESAVQDFIDSVAPTDPNDWWTLARTAQAVPRERIEDYVATAAAVGGPLVPDQEIESGF